MSSVQWTSLADLDVEEILYYITVESGRPETADRIGHEIRRAVE